MLGSAKLQVRDWILLNKDAGKGLACPAVRGPSSMQGDGNDVECLFRLSYLGAAVGLSILIIQKMLQGVAYERRLCQSGTVTGGRVGQVTVRLGQPKRRQ